MRLLLTRPEPEAQRTAAALRARGHDVVVAPVLQIEPIVDAPIGAGPWSAIVVTSANAAQALLAHQGRDALVEIPAFAVGARSGEAMRAAGFADVTSAAGGVEDLVRLVAARLQPAALLLYVAGEQRAGDLAGDLRRRGFAVEMVLAYRATAAARLPEAGAEALALGVDAVLHYSRRSAEAYVNAARSAGLLASALEPAQLCLSAQIAEPLRQAGAITVRVAVRPSEAALFDLLSAASG